MVQKSGNKVLLIEINNNLTLGKLKDIIANNYHIQKNNILVHCGRYTYDKSKDDSPISSLNIHKMIKISENHIPAVLE